MVTRNFLLKKKKFPEKIFRRKSVNAEFSGTDGGARQSIPRDTHWGDVADVKQYKAIKQKEPDKE